MTPAPATVSLPPRSWKRRAAHRDAVLEAPGADVTVRLLLAAEVQFRAGTPMAQCAQLLLDSLGEAMRAERLAAPTIPAPASIRDAVLDTVGHDMGCECPECFPVDDDAQHYCADEGHQVLVDSRGYLGVPSMGGW
jgi:hypothetical protein